MTPNTALPMMPPMMPPQPGMMPPQPGMMPPQPGMMPPQPVMMPPHPGMMPREEDHNPARVLFWNSLRRVNELARQIQNFSRQVYHHLLANVQNKSQGIPSATFENTLKTMGLESRDNLRADTNKDGFVDEQEALRYFENVIVKVATQAGESFKSNDPTVQHLVLSIQEYNRIVRNRVYELYDMADTNKDGRLSPEEFFSFFKFPKEHVKNFDGIVSHFNPSRGDMTKEQLFNIFEALVLDVRETMQGAKDI